MTRGDEWWDKWFLGMAAYVASASKDPSTQVGAVIVDADKRVVSLGFNGFPQGVEDKDERYADRKLKYDMVIHAEANSIIFSQRPLKGCTLYTTPFASCSRCAAMVIQSGIKRCVAPPLPEHLKERWGADLELTAMLFREAGVKLDFVGEVQNT